MVWCSVVWCGVSCGAVCGVVCHVVRCVVWCVMCCIVQFGAVLCSVGESLVSRFTR